MPFDIYMPVGRIGDQIITLFEVGLATVALVIVLFFFMVFSAMRASKRRAAAVQQQLNEFMRLQSEMTGRLQSLSDASSATSAEISRNLNERLAQVSQAMGENLEINSKRTSHNLNLLGERLDQVSHRMGQNLETNAKTTTANLNLLNERLAIIDRAQKNISELSSQVVGLQDILSNKQQRGAFGQGRMEAIIEDGLPKDAYSFQAVLSNKKRPDCLIHLPNNSASIVIDAKFPLESFELLKSADTPDLTKEAVARVRKDVGQHIKDISEKYFIPGETQDTAMMFVPSESLYADLHELFPDILQKAYRARIVIVSPNMMMLAISTMQAILKDAKMREQAAMIQTEVAKMLKDVVLLQDRVVKLDRHFEQAGTDIKNILISAGKVTKRGETIENLDLPESEEGEASALPEVKPVAIVENLKEA